MTDNARKINRPASPPPQTPHAAEKNISNPGEPVTQVAFDLKMEVINARLDNSNLIMIGLLIVLGICFLTLFYGYWQFASTSFNDYSQRVKELNDQRYQLLEERMKNMESRITPSSYPTPVPKQ